MKANPALDTDMKMEAKSGVGKSTVHRYRRAESNASIEHIAELARALGCQPWELLVDHDNDPIADIVRRLLGR